MRTLSTLFFLILFLGACTKTQVPECTYKPSIGEKKLVGNAGCFIKYKGKMLAVKARSGGKLSAPAGFPEGDEIAQCTAFRETFEETGLKATIGKLLYYDDKENFYLFNCSIDEELNYEKLVVLRLQDHDKAEIKNIILVDINKTTLDRWRFPQQLKHFKKFFISN